ncbi:MAG TPA: hypothetical protein VHM19_19260 [Polyangiales bacterium]|jgi:hypothetical protein|nr:hypothetical protein [Polyangiales bacterium]
MTALAARFLAAFSDTLRLHSLSRPRAAHVVFRRALFAGSFATYFVIGQLIHGFHGHEHWNYFFNADPPRVIADLTSAGDGPVSINAWAGHPFFVVLLNPIGGLLARCLVDSKLLAALLLTHTAAALANVGVYELMLELDASPLTAAAAALAHASTTTMLTFGSVPETNAFATLGLVIGLWLAVRSTRVVPSVLVQTFAAGMNGALLAHALFAAPLLWFGRERFGKWLLRTLALWFGIAALGFCLFLLQRRLYPGSSPFAHDGYAAYGSFVGAHTLHALQLRAHRLIPHFFWFCFVAPRPLLTSAPDLITTFMWEQRRQLAHYDALGGALVVLWTCALLTAAWMSFVRVRRATPNVRRFALLTAGWSLGCLGLFSVFGDDLLLFSYFWLTHVIVFVFLGAARALVSVPERARRALALAGCVVAALYAANQLTFVARVLAGYRG